MFHHESRGLSRDTPPNFYTQVKPFSSFSYLTNRQIFTCHIDKMIRNVKKVLRKFCRIIPNPYLCPCFRIVGNAEVRPMNVKAGVRQYFGGIA